MAENIVREMNVATRSDDAERSDDQRVAHLIEQLRQRKSELEAANRELRHVSHYRSLFLARMSHELRTPLTSILGFSEILLDHEELTETQRRFCQKIQNSGLQLLTSLNQLVDMSRLEVGPAELFLHEFSLPETVRDVSAAVDRYAQKNEVKLESEVAPGIVGIVSDQGRLRQVLYTFLAWAVSRSPEGSVVKAYLDLEGPNLMVRIDDDGEPVADISTVFDPEDTTKAGKTDLNELGIIIGRRLLEVMNGSVSLQTRETHGLRTLIRLPVGPTKA